MPSTRRLWTTSLWSALLFVPVFASAQGTLEDYRRAGTISQRYNGLTVGLVQGGANGISWIDDTNTFTYRVSVTGGNQFVFVDAAAGRREPAFDHQRLATGLSAVAGAQYTAITLPFNSFDYVDNRRAIEADAGTSRYRCSLDNYACTRVGDAQAPQGGGFGRGGRGGRGGGGRAGGGPDGDAASDVRVSPDGRTEAFIRDHNLAIRPAGSAQGGGGGGRGGRGGGAPAAPGHTMLSFDGASVEPYQLNSIRWSPDSRKLAILRTRPAEERIVYYVQSSPATQLQPILVPDSGYTKPGDALDVHQPVLFDIASGKQTDIDRSLFPNPYQITAASWRDNGAAYTFEYNQRGHQAYRVLEVNAETGAVRAVINEEVPTFFGYRPSNAGLSDTGHRFRFDIDDGREIIWMSQRDNWAHLYLYDGATGRVKNQITSGDWTVRSVDSVDVANRQIYFQAAGRNAGQDPYFSHFYRINFDGTGLIAYTEADGNHSIGWSPNRQYYVDVYSRVDLPTVVELRRASDRRMTPLERGDMSAALATGWRPPEVFVAKARDGVTDIWGIIVRPFTFDQNRRYPVIEQIYAGPQGSFVPKSWSGGQNLIPTAELGFIMVQIDGMGTNNRSKAFHDVAWKNLADAGFPDRILWHQAVAERYPWYDISRVGVYGTSAGGQNAAGAVLIHGDFYDAAFASSGCHDNRMDKIWWNEHWMGWPIGPHYEASSNVTHAHKLTGKLFLAVGEMDTNVDPASTMQVVDALVRAGKSFELLVVPNGGHGATGANGGRKRNDFFVKSLLGVDPPDWNAGITLGLNDAELDFLGNMGAPPYGFFESAADDSPPYTWW